MEFRLIYEGPLRSNGDAAHKQDIRRKLHLQLRELWQVHPHLNSWLPKPNYYSQAEEIADEFKVGPFKFVPLVTERIGLVCSLDILFLRRDEPGKLIIRGDLDNRLKTLFDSLRTPKDIGEAANSSPSSDETPFFTLMSDDALITAFQVETDRLLKPALSTGHALGDVELIIHVKTKIIDHNKAFIQFL